MASATGYDMDSLLVSFNNTDQVPRTQRQFVYAAASQHNEARPGKAKSRTSTTRKNRAAQRQKEYYRQLNKRQQPKQKITAGSSSNRHADIAIVQVKKEVNSVGIQTENAQLPFLNLFPKHLNAAHRTITHSGFTVFNVRIGQSQAFAELLTSSTIVHNRSTAIVMTIALEEVFCYIKEKYVASKGILCDELKTFGSYPIPLNPYQVFNIYGINFANYKSEKIQFLPLTPDQVIRSCIRQCSQEGAPQMVFYGTEEELWTQISSNGNIHVDVARFMSCYIDASIYALLSMTPTDGLWSPQEVDDYVRKRILQRLLKSHREVTPDIISRVHLDYQQIQKTIPRSTVSELMSHLQPFFSRCDIRPNLHYREMPKFPLLMNSVQDFKQTINEVREITRGTYQEHRLVSSLELKEPPTQLMSPITHQCLTNSLFGANSTEDPFYALTCSRFVNPGESNQDLFKARFGPLELSSHDSFLTFCLMTDRFLKTQTNSQPNFVGNDNAFEIMFGKKGDVKLS